MRNAIACGLGLGALALLGQSAQAQLLEKKAPSLEAARKMVAAAEAEAQRNNWRGVVAVVDDGGWIILVERMDHAALTAGVELAVVDGEVIGGIGASFATPEDDEQVAKAGLAALSQ